MLFVHLSASRVSNSNLKQVAVASHLPKFCQFANENENENEKGSKNLSISLSIWARFYIDIYISMFCANIEFCVGESKQKWE